MTNDFQNPFEAPKVSDYDVRKKAIHDDGILTTVDWLICIFCSGIGCIVGIVRLVQGKKSAGKMIGFSILFGILWRVLILGIRTALGGP